MFIKIVYFALLYRDQWQSIVEEQLTGLKNLDLYQLASEIHMSVIANNTQIAQLKELLKDKYDKIQLTNIFEDNYYEYPGIKTLYELAQADENDTILLYFHTKGMTSGDKSSRQHMFNNTIANYRVYLEEFEKNKDLEVGCALPHIDGFAYYNFFWCRANYIRQYCPCPQISQDRYIWEIWLGKAYCSKKSPVITFSPYFHYNTLPYPINLNQLSPLWSSTSTSNRIFYFHTNTQS
jgi:hypothetical protein